LGSNVVSKLFTPVTFSAWSAEACDEALFDWIIGKSGDDWSGSRRSLGRKRRRFVTDGNEHSYGLTHNFRS